MAIEQGIGSFMNKFSRSYREREIADEREKLARLREEELAAREASKDGGGSGGSGGSAPSDKAKPIADRGLNGKIGLIGSPAPTRAVEARANVGAGGGTGRVMQYDASKAPAFLDGIAQKFGINPDDFKRMAWIESKFDPNARAGSSSAGGLFQFTDGTAKAYGLRDKFDPVANATAAAQLWNDNKAKLSHALGREPTAGELYLAHQQGVGGATALLRNPNASAESVVGSSAFRNNGGKPGMTAQEFAHTWTSRFDGARPAATTPGSMEAGQTPNQARNTRQQTAAMAGGVISDAGDDIRRVVPTGAVAMASTPSSAKAPTTTAPTAGGGSQFSPGGALTEGKSMEQAYQESLRRGQPAATTAQPAQPAAAPAAAPQPAVAPPGTHYEQFGPNKILMDDKTGAPVANLKGWSGASDGAKIANGETPVPATPTGAVTPANEPPEFPKTAGQEPPLPPKRSDETPGPPMQTATPATQAAPTPAQEQPGAKGKSVLYDANDDPITSLFKGVGTLLSGDKIVDKNGREWDPMQGWVDPKARAAEPSKLDKSSAATASDGPLRDKFGREWDMLEGWKNPGGSSSSGMLEKSSAETSKSILDDKASDPIRAGFSGALNIIAGLFS